MALRATRARVYVGICTHLGCSPKYVESENFEETGQEKLFLPVSWLQVRFGRAVVAGVPAPYNLEVPPYQFESDTVIVIG